MKCLTHSDWLHCAAIFSTATVLTISTLNLNASLALTQPELIARSSTPAKGEPSRIAAKTLALRKSNRRWIEIDLSSQRLIAWQGKTPYYAVIISTGKDSTPTPTGVFEIQSKLRSARMQGDDYDLPDVPFTMFYSGNYAIHGAYWHHRFGTPVSHGCVNVAVDHAQRLFNWASVGTPVVVRH